jgi:NitT/TauT family transport system substrate-binding protein
MAFKLIVCLIVSAAIAVVAGGSVRAAERSPVTVRIGVVSRSTLDLPYYVARDRGFFRDEGLEPEMIFIRSSLSVQAILGGSLDFGTATGTAVSAIVNGADIRVVMAMTDKPAFDLIAHPGITKIAELRGKRIGFGGIGGLAEITLRRILAAHQISTEEVKFLPMGQNSLTYTSLKAGMIDATMLQMPQNFVAQDEGFRKLAAASDYYRIVQGGLAASKATVAERPELVTRVIRATLKAMRWLRTQKKQAIEFMKGPYLDLGSEKDRFTERIYDVAVQAYLSSGIVDEKLQREMIAAASQRLKPAVSIAPERVFDFSSARMAGVGGK